MALTYFDHVACEVCPGTGRPEIIRIEMRVIESICPPPFLT